MAGTVSFAPSDNGKPQATGDSTPSEPATPGTAAGSSPLSGLNKGAMAALLVRPKPLDLPPFAFADGDGATKTLADFAGKVVLLNIWATRACPAARRCRRSTSSRPSLAARISPWWR